ncbi:hypothetical protein HZH68_015941 [Vespula germanica]|uniref:Uncharacterized protein n=1 Tax=Vespula germanica TaxID=30212 RepID=A0A834J2V4_VESGE|nr:hypothetical protein HZH68_015941 [Vespula germanica]
MISSRGDCDGMHRDVERSGTHSTTPTLSMSPSTIRGISADKITEEFVEAAKFGNSAKERKGEASFDWFIDRSVT